MKEPSVPRGLSKLRAEIDALGKAVDGRTDERRETRPPLEVEQPQAQAPSSAVSSSVPAGSASPAPSIAQSRPRQSSAASGCLVAGLIGSAFAFLILLALVSEKSAPARGSTQGSGPAPADASAWNDLGNKAAERQDWQQAVQHYERAAQLAPSDPVVLGNLGAAYTNAGQFDRAISAFQTALANPKGANEPGLVVWLSASHILAGHYAEGLKHAERASRLAPQDADAHHWKARAFLGLGRPSDAKRSARVALRLKSDHAGAQALLETLKQEADAARSEEQTAALAETDARAAPEAELRPQELVAESAPSSPRQAPIAVPRDGRWANSRLSDQERENVLRACFAASNYTAPSGHVYQCDEESLTAVQATNLLIYRLLQVGRYRQAITLYREAAPQQPQLRARVAGLASQYRNMGEWELAYCLDPSNEAIRAEFEMANPEMRGYCAETLKD